ncbi:7176_t:CDS:2 [Dentiscutata erythropus]|uniref:7176_t:CDS:1 n=1 Tax=Dentiscutata erythropus TaxID=1348616 RepID=A0A9N8Z8L8_9GLOM|nr:7176_t:CDS:2 [Dentiscutata erythropus]
MILDNLSTSIEYTILCENETAREWREKGFLLWLEENGQYKRQADKNKDYFSLHQNKNKENSVNFDVNLDSVKFDYNANSENLDARC